MAISLVGNAVGDLADPPVVTLPGGIAENDVVYAASATSNTSDADVTESSGTYAQIADLYANDTTDNNFGVFRKVQGGTPDSTVSVDAGASGQASIAMTLRGADTTTPEDQTTAVTTAIDGGTPDPPAIVTVTANAWVLAFAGSSEADAVTNPPTDYTDLVDQQGVNRNVMAARREIAAPGSENPGTYADIVGTTADTWCAATIAVRPAADAGATVIPVSASAGHTVAAGALAQINLLVSVSPLAGHTVAAGGLAQVNTLVSVSGTQGHSVAAPALTRVLIAVAALQGHTVAPGGLAQANSLLGVSATQGHEVAAPGFTIAGVTLIPVDVIAGHLVAAPALSQTAILQMATAIQGHTVASPALAQTNLLISVSSTAGHTVAASALLQQNIQRVANAIAGHIADPGSFSTATVITVVDAITGHTAQVGILQLFAIGQSSPSRIYAVLEDGRTYLVLPRNETIH